uniref:DNA topoisomerase 1 n=1 Tax=Candidatus Aschnera chinzeii TaxID=1485666 RepID=A0AAT9G586_9ENTR|nr:MAG: type I DNA topoisomerase [Candidatus Aschnera chinzeii]
MDKNLVIVESLTKAKTINKYLGNNYIVKSSIGHVRDLPKKNNITNRTKKTTHLNKTNTLINSNEYNYFINKIGIDPYHGWEANYQILPGKEKIISELKSLADNVKHIFLATDLDREGEAIAWHLREVIGGDQQKYSRVIFNEITKNAIKKSFDNPTILNINRVNAQQARRFLDRIVGYMLSPLLWKKISRGLSAGRVQSVAVRLIVEREKSIKSFIPEEFWKLSVELSSNEIKSINMQITHQNNKLFKPKNKTEIDNIIKLLHNTSFKITSYIKQKILHKSHPPFITSTLQQAASIQLGFGIKKTMIVAQLLYEAGYITYVRTDSTNVSEDAINMVRKYIKSNFGKDYLPKIPNIYKNQQSSQEAHEAIRPSDVNIISDDLNNIKLDAKKLYQLIWRQFVASQMISAQSNITTLVVEAENFKLKTQWKNIIFDGWSKIIPGAININKNLFTSCFKVGEYLNLNKLIPTQHFTQPPSRYTESSLVQKLEKMGIGRPSTYPLIISTIQDRGYVKIENNKFYAEKIGEIVTDRLNENFQELMDYNFTAQMENKLDQIANNQLDWKIVLDEFFISFVKKIKNAHNLPEQGGMQTNKTILTSIKCSNCYKPMGIKTASTGVFLSCSGYNLSKIPCKTTFNCIPEKELLNIFKKNNYFYDKHIILPNISRCKKCNFLMDIYIVDNRYKIYICGNNPICDNYEVEQNIIFYQENSLFIKCDKCHDNMYIQIGRFGKYLACINQNCKNTRNIFKNGQIAPPKEEPIPLPELKCTKSNSYFVLRNGTSGIFLAANTFPESRETRPLLVEELILIKDRIAKKFDYLTTAPIVDPYGNKTIIVFNRKTKQQYITSKKNNKITNWQAHYIDGKWITNNK